MVIREQQPPQCSFLPNPGWCMQWTDTFSCFKSQMPSSNFQVTTSSPARKKYKVCEIDWITYLHPWTSVVIPLKEIGRLATVSLSGGDLISRLSWWVVAYFRLRWGLILWQLWLNDWERNQCSTLTSPLTSQNRKNARSYTWSPYLRRWFCQYPKIWNFWLFPYSSCTTTVSGEFLSSYHYSYQLFIDINLSHLLQIRTSISCSATSSVEI